MPSYPETPAVNPQAPAAGTRRRLLLGLSGCLLTCFAVATVFGGGFTPKGTQPPLATPIESPGSCASCHGDYDAVNNIEPYPTWAGSMMANASRDPLFWAALDVANNDVAGAGDFCLRCHVPSGWLGGRSEPPGGSQDGCGMLGAIDEPESDFEGISCHFCHRMMVNDSPPPGEDPVYFENGQAWIDDTDCTTPGTGPCRRGPYDYAGAGETPPPHPWTFSQYHLEAGFCGNCHNVTSPATTLIDDSGTDTGIPFPVERTYKEWQQSDFGSGGGQQSCQSCHMPDTGVSPAYACVFESNDRTGNMAVHRFVGGNVWIPAVLRDEYPNLGRTDSYNATVAWAQDMLANQTAMLELTAPATAPVGGTLDLGVRVTNLSGHKLPTGYSEGRRMWLNVQVRDTTDTLIFESGAYDPATGTLTHDAQAKVYERESGIWNANATNQCDLVDGGGDPMFHFVLNNCIAKDNRIPPAGFSGGTDPETRPVAYSYPETSPGSGILVNFDDTSYSVPLPPGAVTPLSVEARLYFQTTSKEYVEFLRDQAVDGSFPDDCIARFSGTPVGTSRGELLYSLWQTYGRSAPFEMQLGTGSVDLVDEVFSDGFESGDVSAWSSSIP
ncbi:MAG: hypothetical protein KDD47_20525 [Acidobacteria bacterium]|nr:hypothetical protein [Acidobacteriota bacterium]